MMPSLDLSICALGALNAQERSAIVGLCTAAFDEDFAILFDNAPATLIDLRAMHRGQLIGHACWWPRRFQPQGAPELDTAYIKLVAVDPLWQGRGIGSLGLRRFADETRGHQLRALSTTRPAFYERLGWQRWRGQYGTSARSAAPASSAGLLMILPTEITPPLDRDAFLTVEQGGGGHW
jgi:GNAT superfamily N-acetyltransferase